METLKDPIKVILYSTHSVAGTRYRVKTDNWHSEFFFSRELAEDEYERVVKTLKDLKGQRTINTVIKETTI